MASQIATRLRGKHKASYTPHMDDGDHVIVINADKVVFTGKKREDKVYYHYTGFQGGIKERTARFVLEGRFPERDRREGGGAHAPAWPARPQAARQPPRLQGAEHPHEAQQPTVWDVGTLNRKNTIAQKKQAA